MRIKDLFVADVARDIPPVVYFHEQSPAKLATEVSEYIITGGYPEGDPRRRRVGDGIHEQFVRLLRNIVRELDKGSGPELPASWISGFYGSGKSSFAKLLGLALDGAKLPDGSALATALLRRDDSPRGSELAQAWEALSKRISPIAVVFDIGGVARDNEHIHAAVLREVQRRLGYCGKSRLVAEHELKLEIDGQWPAFVAAAEKTLGRAWTEANDDELAEDHFSHVMHVLDPKRYTDPMSWVDSRAGARTGAGSSVKEAVDAIDAMMNLRGENKTLFIVVDEVSQYVHQDESRMLKLQSFVSELGQRLKGLVWLFATGQQKLEDVAEANNIGKLKDRFPTSLRVHLATTNIRDVVHKRLLKKAKDKEAALLDLFQRHRSDLKLYGYACEEITQEDFLEVYPLLPGHVDLLMQVTSNLRTRSSRAQGDDHAIRGLLQLLGELFREQKLGDREVGELITLDAIFEVQHSALDPDVQNTLSRVFNHPDIRDDVLGLRAAKAVALLELIQETVPTTSQLVAQCLYARLGEGNQVGPVTQALEKLRSASLLGYSEKHGYKIQSSAGQEWQRERDEVYITQDQVSLLVRDKLRDLLATPERPKYKSQPFPWAAFYSDGRLLKDEKILDPRVDASVTVDFRYLAAKDDRESTAWVSRSAEELLRDRIVWIVGDSGSISGTAKELAKSRHMVQRHGARKESLPREKQQLLIEETGRSEDLERALAEQVAEAFNDGAVFIRGRSVRPRDHGSSFAAALHAIATRALPDLYPHFTEIAVTETELGQLLDKTLSGPSLKFLDKGLGILSLDAGKYVPSCAGTAPTTILQHIESGGSAGALLISKFGRPPYGWPPDVVRACVAGLLRAGKIRIRPEEGPEITSVIDPGTRDLFRKERDIRRADIFPARTDGVQPRDRVTICNFFKKHLDIDVDRENDAIADAVYQQFPARREELREVETRLAQLPGRPALPTTLAKFGKSLEDCRRSRQVEETVLSVKRRLDVLGDGFEQLGIFRADLTNDAIEAVRAAARVRDEEIQQLRSAEALAGVEDDAGAIESQLASDRPWRDVGSVDGRVKRLRDRYVDFRRGILNAQNGEAETVRRAIKGRPGFERLTPDQSHEVLRPITEALSDTTAEAVHPTLVEMRDRFRARLDRARDAANQRLDDLLARLGETQIAKVEIKLQGREVANQQQLDALVDEIRERIGKLVAEGKRVRIV